MVSASGVEWIIAVIAPWTISPHPNFGDQPSNAASQLALVAEGRERRERRDKQPHESKPDLPGWSTELYDAARASLVSESQVDATQKLERLVHDGSLPVGARVAAALYATVALVDQDLNARAEELLESLLAEYRASQLSASERVCLGALMVQLSLRYYDRGARDASEGMAREARVVLRMNPKDRFDSFDVSPGISWQSRRVQQDVIDDLRATAFATIATLADYADASWERVVKSRSGWVEARRSAQCEKVEALVLRDEFDNQVDTFSSSVHFMREGPVASAYAMVLIAEFSGRISTTKRARETLGKVIMLSGQRSEHEAVEAIRAFRRSGSEKPLQATLNWLRNDGPSKALVTEARHLLKIAQLEPTSESLKILEYAAEFLDPDLLQNGIRYAYAYSSQPRTQYRAPSSFEEAAWRAVSRLVEGSGAELYVAQRLVDRLHSNIPITQVLADNLTLVLSKLGWANLPQTLQVDLQAWASDTNSTDAESTKDFISSNAQIGTATRPVPRNSLNGVIHLINREDSDRSLSNIAESANWLIQRIDEEQSEAGVGSFSFGGPSILDISTAFAARFSHKGLWVRVVEALVDPKTHSMQKLEALDRLANSADKVPPEAKRVFAERFDAVLKPKGRPSFFDQTELTVDPGIVRASIALEVVSANSGMEMVLAMSAESARGRLEGAKTLAHLARVDEAAFILLLQLSHDGNPDVRAEAAYSMASTAHAARAMTGPVVERLTLLGQADGVKVPLRVFHGLQFLLQSGQVVPEKLLRLAAAVAGDPHSARVVRGAAERVTNRH